MAHADIDLADTCAADVGLPWRLIRENHAARRTNNCQADSDDQTIQARIRWIVEVLHHQLSLRIVQNTGCQDDMVEQPGTKGDSAHNNGSGHS